MQYKIILKPEAEIDLDKAINWYEDKQVGLGIDFLLHFENTLLLVQQNPFQFLSVIENFKRVLIQKFPYITYFSVDEKNSIVDIYGVLHTSRNPKIYKKKIEK